MQVSGLLTDNVCRLWCVITEANYECETTCQLLPPANLGLTKWIEDTLQLLNIKTVFWMKAIGSYCMVEFSLIIVTGL